MMTSLIVLAKIFLLFELAMSFVVIAFFFFFEGLNYFAEGAFYFDNLWRGLKGATYGAIPVSLILWFFYHLLPLFKK